MPQFCECGRLMEYVTMYQKPDFSNSNNPSGRLAIRRVFQCPACRKERITDGHGKEVKE